MTVTLFADNNRRDFYCENTCLTSWPEVKFWPGGRDLWPLHFDSGTFIQQEGVRGWTPFERSWLADSGTDTLSWGNFVLFGLDPGPSSLLPWRPHHHETHDPEPRLFVYTSCRLNIMKLNSRHPEPDVHHLRGARLQFLLYSTQIISHTPGKTMWIKTERDTRERRCVLHHVNNTPASRG